MLFGYWTLYLLTWYFLNFNPKVFVNEQESTTRQPSRAEIASIQGRINYKEKRYATALVCFSKSLKYAKDDKVDSCRINSTIALANCFRSLNYIKKSEFILHQLESDYLFEDYKNSFNYVTYLMSKSILSRKQGDTIKSLKLIDSALQHALLWVNPLDTFLTLLYQVKGYIFFKQNQLDSSLANYQTALLTRNINNKDKIDDQLLDIYIALIKIYELKGDYKNMIHYIEPTINLIGRSFNKDTSKIINYYNLKVFLDNKLGKFDEALNDITQLETFLKGNTSRIQNYINTQFNKCKILSIKGDYTRVESIYLNLINNKILQNKINSELLSLVYLDLASIYYNRDQFKQALTYYQKCASIGLKINIENSACYNGMGSCYFLIGDTARAETYYKLAIDTRISYHGVNTPKAAREYLSYSVFLKRVGRIKEGLTYLLNALAIYKNHYGEKYRQTSESYSWLGSFYLDEGQPEKALECFQKALVSAVENFGNYDPSENPSLSGTYFGPELIEALKYKAQALQAMYLKEPGNLALLNNEFNTYDLALKAINKQRTSFPELTSKLSVSGNERSTYLGAIESAFQLYRSTGNLAYKTKAFEFAEKSRSAILLTSLREKQAISYGGIPDSLIEKEKSYGQMIEKYQGMILEERQKEIGSTEVIKEIENKIFQLQNDQNNLIARFEKQFPQYYQLKYSDKILDIPVLQKRLLANQAILEYAVTEKRILIFVITRNSFDIIPVSRTPVFDESLKGLNTYLREVSFISQDRNEYEKFINAAHILFTKLIQPVETIIRQKELIIVPDEILYTVPFEVLLTEKAESSQEFSTLPYLIEKYPVGYAYSANLLFFNYKKVIPEKVRLAAFSPSYEVRANSNANEPYLRPLKFAKEETRSASGFFRGKVFDGENATETAFKGIAEKYDILHLAMHAIMDNENPMYSKLAFTREGSKENDGYLNTYELFNMKLKARMVVLSACNTGAGTLQKGEGIMSLARGFYYAGCPDVIMTLWPVEDKMSTQLIKDFYTYLSQGKNKIEALQMAKMNLIRSSDPLRSHPFFWAGYVNIGDVSPVISIPKKKPTSWLWVFTVGISLLLIVPMVWKKLSLK
jgi:CHAT domain-containing protein